MNVTIYNRTQNKIDAGRPWPAPSGQPAAVQICSRQICQDPAKLERLIKMIDKEQWSTLPADVKGEIYEGLLDADPACSHNSILLAAHDYTTVAAL